jgi:ribose transport system substrate-binding protein
MHLPKQLSTPVAVMALMLAAAGLAGCSDSSDASDSGTGGGEADLAAAQAMVDEYSAPPEFEAPGEPFDASAAMAGATIASIPVNSAIDFTQFYAKAGERIAGEVGFDFTTWPNQGNPTEWGQGFQKALSEDADLIELFAGIDPAQIAPQMSQAADAGVPVVAADGYDLTQEVDPALATAVNCPCSQAARIMAAWVTVQTEGDGNFLVLTSSDVKASAASEDAMKDELATLCPDCEADYIDIPSADWATKILPQVQSALVADPDIDYVLPVFDTMSIWAVQGITQAGRQDEVKIATYNGTPSILDMMRDSDIIEMNVGQSNDWMAHVTLDQQMRVVAGLPTNPDATWPLYIWTKDNLDEAGNPATDSQGYGDEYQDGFRTLWGLS